MKARLLYLLASLFFLTVTALRADTAEQWISKARSYLGNESDLNAVEAVKITGKIRLVDKVAASTDKTKLVDAPVDMPVEILFQKPYQQRITISRPEVVMVDGLDGYDAWQKRIDPKNPSQWRLSLLDARGIKNLRANTWENLNFYRGLEKKGGSVSVDGDRSVDGVACVKVSFSHGENLVFQRFFEKTTGRLVKTITDNGTEIREEGSVVVKGVRFPRKVINKAANGEVTTIEFDTVIVNEKVPAATFAVPGLQTQ